MSRRIIVAKKTKPTADQKLEAAIFSLLSEIGENPKREGLIKTPHRVAQSMQFLTKGYRDDVKKILNGALFSEPNKEMVIVKDISYFSMCEHHLLPFYGKIHIAYIPNGKVVGLSKIPRIVDMFARRLQLQERMTRQIAMTLDEVLKPEGVAVVCEGKHMCMMMRGVEKQQSHATTSAMIGVFESNMKTRTEFLTLITNKLS
ncbi:MAG: GTP cyclohydrolase I FolE [Bacteroidetes bacterium]|nr:GTP cyclohydrolase I FolE [Bacteroidota bacterium]